MAVHRRKLGIPPRAPKSTIKKDRRAYYAVWYSRNKDRQKKYIRAWRDLNRHKGNAAYKKYQCRKRQAFPKWANEFFIEEIYHLAQLRTKYLGIRHDVDHIVPLQSPLVCGLHCEANLRVIPAAENRRKHNKTWPGMPS